MAYHVLFLKFLTSGKINHSFSIIWLYKQNSYNVTLCQFSSLHIMLLQYLIFMNKLAQCPQGHYCFKGDIMQVLAHLSMNYSIILLQTVNWAINHSDQSFYLLQAIEALNAATRVKPVPPLFMLLGKTQMKAKEFKDAITSFDRALQLYVSFTNRKSVIFVVNCRNCHVLRGIFSKFLCYS